MDQPAPPKLTTFPRAKQRQLDQLLDKNAQGSLTTAERAKLGSLVAEAETLMVENARQLAEFARSQAPQAPVAAVPITVWVAPQPAEH